MSIINFLVDAAATIAVYGFIPFLIFLFVVPFLITRYIAKKAFSVLAIVVDILLGAALVMLALYGAYWGVIYLQGAAFKAIHGFQQESQTDHSSGGSSFISGLNTRSSSTV